jgi:hypothetical protein
MGFNLETFTVFHVVLSLVGIASGLVCAFGWLTGRRFHTWETVFLVTTAATSLTGFGFPFHTLLPSHIVGIISLAVLAGAVVARVLPMPANAAALIFVSTAMLALYLNVFVLIVQLFQKVPALKALAPTQSEPPFVIAQAVVLVAYLALSVVAVLKARKTSPTPLAARTPAR